MGERIMKETFDPDSVIVRGEPEPSNEKGTKNKTPFIRLYVSFCLFSSFVVFIWIVDGLDAITHGVGGKLLGLDTALDWAAFLSDIILFPTILVYAIGIYRECSKYLEATIFCIVMYFIGDVIIHSILWSSQENVEGLSLGVRVVHWILLPIHVSVIWTVL